MDEDDLISGDGDCIGRRWWLDGLEGSVCGTVESTYNIPHVLHQVFQSTFSHGEEFSTNAPFY